VSPLAAIVAGVLATAAVSTAGDYLWANVLPHGQPVYWFAHAVVLFLTVGFWLGRPSGRAIIGAIGGAAVGCAATAGYWALQPVIGYLAIFAMFVGLWVGLGLLTGRVLQQAGSMPEVLVRSALAATGSGLAFYAISGIWRPFEPHGWDYARHFAYWTLAYMPGFAALLLRRAA
jgi:hypothetical protein